MVDLEVTQQGPESKGSEAVTTIAVRSEVKKQSALSYISNINNATTVGMMNQIHKESNPPNKVEQNVSSLPQNENQNKNTDENQHCEMELQGKEAPGCGCRNDHDILNCNSNSESDLDNNYNGPGALAGEPGAHNAAIATMDTTDLEVEGQKRLYSGNGENSVCFESTSVFVAPLLTTPDIHGGNTTNGANSVSVSNTFENLKHYFKKKLDKTKSVEMNDICDEKNDGRDDSDNSHDKSIGDENKNIDHAAIATINCKEDG